MRFIVLMTLMLLLTGCETVRTSEAAICSSTLEARDDLADALLEDGGPESVVAGAYLIERLDRGCLDT